MKKLMDLFELSVPEILSALIAVKSRVVKRHPKPGPGARKVIDPEKIGIPWFRVEVM